jgi:hypothetical protein
MAANLVSLVMQFLTPDMIGRIAAALGLERSTAQTAIGAAVPALLAGFTGAAAKSGGAQQLANAVKQQSGVLDRFANTISGTGQAALADTGSKLLSSLLGDQNQSALAGAVAKFSGLGQGASNSLLGMLAPVAMATIGKQFGTRGPDASGLASLLFAQKDNIADALPSGFAKLLGGTGLPDGLGGVADATTAAASQVTRAPTGATDYASQYASSTVRSVGNTGQRAANVATSAARNWLYWLIPLAVIAGALWYFFGQRAEQAAQQAAPVQSVMLAGVDIGKQLGDSLGILRTSLQGVTDAASARAALPKLQEVTTQVDKVSSVAGQLSADQRKTIGGLIRPAMATLNQLFDKVLAIPGVGEILRPTIDALKMKLAVLAG